MGLKVNLRRKLLKQGKDSVVFYLMDKSLHVAYLSLIEALPTNVNKKDFKVFSKYTK